MSAVPSNMTSTTDNALRLAFADADGPSLKEVVARGCKHLDVGAAVLPKPLLVLHDSDNSTNHDANNPYANVLELEFNAIVVEHHLKWTPLCHTQPGPLMHDTPSDRLGRYDFHHADQVVDWALQRGIKVKGHVLCWHVTTPDFVSQLSPAQVEQELKRHIFTTMGHYRGRIQTWDVVNEALAPDGSLAQTVFLEKLGPSYIEQCFHWAHEADPTATLLYNDNKVEGMGGPNAAKSDGFYRLLQDLVSRNVPVHGCGLQAHFNAAGVGRHRPPTPRMVKQQIQRLGALGLRVNLSELDVRVSQLPAHLRTTAQRQIYRDVLAAALTEPNFDGVWLWGFTDRHTWVTHFYYDDEPLIYDEDYQRKEAYYGLREALASLTPGNTVGAGVLLDSDVDDHGQPWGYEWMQPEPSGAQEEDAAVAGDARPDWLQSET